MSLIVRNVRPWARTWDTPTCDIALRDGRIHAIAPSLEAGPGDEVVDGAGGVVLPSLTDAHAHLDSTRLGLPFRPHTAGDSLASLVANDLANWRDAEKDVTWRATHTLGLIIASGATTVHTHAQVDPYSGLDRLEGILAAKQTHAERADVRVVAFPQTGIVRSPGTADLLDAALRAGADAIGGIDPCAFDRDPVEHLRIVFDLAEKHGCDVDIHLHERGSLGAFTLELIAEHTRAAGLTGRVTVSHAFALATQSRQSERDRLIRLLADADIAVTTIAPAGGTLPILALTEAGVRVGLGEDGMRDYWSPYGDGDMLRRVWQLAFESNFRHDADIEAAYETASLGGRAVTWGRDHDGARATDRGLGVGCPANLLVVAAETVTSAIMDCPNTRLVIHRGRVVARDGELI